MVVGLAARKRLEAKNIAENKEKLMAQSLSVLIDTHILVWILTRSRRLNDFTWLCDYSRWTISPVSLLEMRFLYECGKISADLPGVFSSLRRDARFHIDDISLEEVCEAALDLHWTRDPFDRLLVAHSMARSLPLGTCDALIRKKYSLVL